MKLISLFTRVRNRLDGIIWFNHLSQDIILQVVDKFLVELEAQLDAKGVVLDVTVTHEHTLLKKAMTKPWERDLCRG